jgi:hypothetical protein
MTNKKVAAVRLVERDEAVAVMELPEDLRVPLAGIAGVAREGLLAMHEMMNAEMTAKVGAAKHAKVAGREANWHGEAPGRSCWAVDGCRRTTRGAVRPTSVRSSSIPTRRSRKRTCVGIHGTPTPR